MPIHWEALALTMGLPLLLAAGAGLAALFPGLAGALDVRSGKPFLSLLLIFAISVAAIAGWGFAALPVVIYAVVVVFATQWMLRRGTPFFDGLVVSCAAAFVGLAGGLTALYAIYGGDPVASLIAWIEQTLTAAPADSGVDDALAIMATGFASLAKGDFSFSGLVALQQEYLSMPRAELIDIVLPVIEDSVRLQTPSWVVGMSVYGGLLGWAVPHLALWRARRTSRAIADWYREAPEPPAFAGWSIPRWVSLPMMVMLVLAFIVRYAGWEPMAAVSLAVENLVMKAFMVQGIAVIWFWLTTRRTRIPGRVTVIALIFLIARGVLSWIGLFDMIFGIRRFWSLRQQMLSDLRRRQSGEQPGDAGDEHKKEDEDR